MLFNIYYDGNTPSDFSIDLTENALIHPNSMARLLKAYIPKAKKVTLNNTKICDLIVNDRNADAIAINIPATGDIDLQTLANQITTAINTAMTGLNINIQGSASYDRTKGSSAGAFNIVVNAMSRYFTTIETVAWNTAPYNVAGYLAPENVDGVTSDTTYAKISVGDEINHLNVTFTGAGGATDSFAQACTADSLVNLTHFSKNVYNNLSFPPSQLSEFGSLQFTLGNDIETQSNSVWFGMSTTRAGGIADRQPNADVGFLDRLNNLHVAVFCPFEAFPATSARNSSANAYAVGGLYIWEKQDNGDMDLVVDDDNYGLEAGDEIAISTANGHHVAYHIKKNGETTWEEIDVIDGRNRVLTPQDATLYPAWSIFKNRNSAVESDLIFEGGSLDNGDINDYGNYIQMSLTQDFADVLGFTQLTYTDDDILASVDASNQQNFNLVSATDNTPFVNVNVTNLPLQGFINYDTGQVGLSDAPNLGTISRFNQDGSLIAVDNLYMDYPTHAVELNNANEMNVSQLKFQIRDSDGKIPTDLSTPLGIVFEIIHIR